MNELQSLNKPKNDQKPLSHGCEARKSLILSEIRYNIIQRSSYKMKTEPSPKALAYMASCHDELRRSFAGNPIDPGKDGDSALVRYPDTEREEKRDGDPIALRQSPIENRTQPAISAADVAESLLT